MTKQTLFIGSSYTGGWKHGARRTKGEFSLLERTYHDAGEFVASISPKAAEIAASKDLTDSGKRNATREWAKTQVRPIIAKAREHMEGARSYATKKRASLGAPTADRTDVVGAMIRAELRQVVRAMEPAKRIAMFAIGEVDPTMALAIIEAPAVLSGVTEDQRTGLIDRAAMAKDPALAEELLALEDAQQTVDQALRAVERALTKEAGLSSDDVAELFGRPTYAQKLGAITAGLNDEDQITAA